MKLKKVISKLILLSIILVTIISYNVTTFAEETITKDCRYGGHMVSPTGYTLLARTYTEDGNSIDLQIDGNKYNFPKILVDYRYTFLLRVTFNKANNEVSDCKIVDIRTGNVVEDLSEENIKRLFDIEYGKTIIEKNGWNENIKLSELKENEVYKYTANEFSKFPKIENDIGKNAVVHIKGKEEEYYEKVASMKDTIEKVDIPFFEDEYEANESFYIMYEKDKNKHLVSLISESDIVYLSKYSDGEKIKDSHFNKYIYNDTDKKITLKIVDGDEKSDFEIDKNELYEYKWGFDDVYINVISGSNANGSENEAIPVNNTTSNNTNNENKTNSVNNKTNTNTNKTNTTKVNKNNSTNDKVVATTTNKANNQVTSQDIPKTGEEDVIFFIIFGAIIFSLLKFKKYYDLDKDMK